MSDAPVRDIVRSFDCALDDNVSARMVELSCGHFDTEADEHGHDKGSPRPCWSCWREARQRRLAERRAKRRKRR